MVRAAEQSITIGETRDFQFRPMDAGNYSFEVRDLEAEKLIVTLIMHVE